MPESIPFLTHHAEADVLRRRSALTAFAGRNVRAATQGLATALVVAPFGDIASQIENAGLAVRAAEAADFLEQRRLASELLDGRLQALAIFGIERVACPEIQ